MFSLLNIPIDVLMTILEPRIHVSCDVDKDLEVSLVQDLLQQVANAFKFKVLLPIAVIAIRYFVLNPTISAALLPFFIANF